MMKTVIAVSIVVAVALASPLVKRQAADTYVLPDGAELIVGEIRSTFSCDGKIYGYYADPDNACKIFHVCVPYELPEGINNIPPVQIFSFLCGNQTIFDQEKLTCNYEADSTPCDQATNFYSRNEDFGKTDAPPAAK